MGNHELYNFSPGTLAAGPLNRGNHVVAGDGVGYRSFSPAEGWTFVVLDPYAVSAMRPEGSPGRAEAEAILRAKNPNPVLDGQCDYFEGLEGPALRYVPFERPRLIKIRSGTHESRGILKSPLFPPRRFNGGLGADQLAWLARTLDEAGRRGDAVVVLSHLPLYHEAASWRNVAYDAPDAARVMAEAGNVCCVLAGHSHRGGFATDSAGIHHVTVEATLTHETAFAVATCRSDGSLDLAGQGAVPSRTFAPPSARVVA